MATIEAWLNSVITQDENGNKVEAKIKAAAVYSSDKTTTVQAHMDNAEKHLTAAEKQKITNAGTANNFCLLDATGKVPASQVSIPTGFKTDYNRATFPDLQGITDPQQGDTCFIEDATGDTTVTTGWAIYRYNGTMWQKIMEQEAMDAVITHNWADINNKPTSDVHDIDVAAVKAKLKQTKIVYAIPDVWPTDVASDGILFFCDQPATI